MNHLTLERYTHDPALRREIEAAARRERARVLARFLAQSAAALLGRDRRRTPAEPPCPEPCA